MAQTTVKATFPEAALAAQKAALPRDVLLLETPLGRMALVQRGDYLSELRLNGDVHEGETFRDTPLLTQAAQQLSAYFAGVRQAFDLPLAPLGTPFQTLVWETLAATVSFGQTVSYGELAKRCDRPAAARAVGMANHQNPLPILIPCHRVIGANGKLVGYGGGLPFKEHLLALENARYRR